MRILNWHFTGNPTMQSFYADQDYSPEEVRLFSDFAPGGGVTQVDIRDDGVSIFSDYAKLSGEQTLEELAGNFPDSTGVIEKGSIISCHIIDTGGASNLNIQLELEELETDVT